MLPVNTTRQRIIEAAAELFLEKGFAGVSMDAIAEFAGFTKVTLYQHVRSKEDLLLDCLKWRLENREVRLDAYFAERPRSPSPVLDLFTWMAEKSATESFRGCAFLKAVSEMAATMAPVRGIALESKKRLRERIVRLLRETRVADREHVGDLLALLLEGAQAMSLVEQSPRPFVFARRVAAELSYLRWDTRMPLRAVKSKARR